MFLFSLRISHRFFDLYFPTLIHALAPFDTHFTFSFPTSPFTIFLYFVSSQFQYTKIKLKDGEYHRVSQVECNRVMCDLCPTPFLTRVGLIPANVFTSV